MGIRYAVRPQQQQQQQQPQKQLQQQDHQLSIASTSSQNASAVDSGSVLSHRRTSMVQSQSQQSIFWRTQGINNISERLDCLIFTLL